jgi:cobalt/nickel transport protein
MRLEIIVVVLILIFTGLFLYVSGSTDAEFGGADGEAEGVIAELTGGTYEPIADPLWEPPSGEIESLLFGLQIALGAIIIGYFFGYYRGRNQSG